MTNEEPYFPQCDRCDRRIPEGETYTCMSISRERMRDGGVDVLHSEVRRIECSSCSSFRGCLETGGNDGNDEDTVRIAQAIVERTGHSNRETVAEKNVEHPPLAVAMWCLQTCLPDQRTDNLEWLRNELASFVSEFRPDRLMIDVLTLALERPDVDLQIVGEGAMALVLGRVTFESVDDLRRRLGLEAQT